MRRWIFQIEEKINLKLIATILFFMILCSAAFAQNKEQPKKNKITNSIGVSIGLSDFHVRDELASPLIYRHMGITGSGEYVLSGENYKHLFEASGYYDILKSSSEHYEAENGRIGGRYNYLHKITELNLFKNRLTVFGGGGIYSFLNYSFYREFISEIGLITISYYMLHSAELSIWLDYSIGSSNQLSLKLNLPLISNASRPTYSTATPGTNQVGEFSLFGTMAAFWETPAVQLKTAYSFKISKLVSISAQYVFHYLYYSVPRKIAMYMNDFRVGIYFLF